MVRNNLEIDVKVKCMEEKITQAELAEKVGTPASYVSRLIRREEGVINNTYIKMLEQLGYDIEMVYIPRDDIKDSVV